MMKIDSMKATTAVAVSGGGVCGGGKVGVGVDDDMGDGMQCSDHPYRNNPGGICAFCLQEKLGKLVSSSLPLPPPIHASSSSFSSPSPSSPIPTVSATSNTVSVSVSKTLNFNAASDCHYHSKRARIPFLLPKKKKKLVTDDIVFKRSKSTTPRRAHFLDPDDDSASARDFCFKKRTGFWSFFYPASSSASKSHAPPQPKKTDKNTTTTTTILEEEEGDESFNSQTTGSASATSFDRKVSRSRSVGCGSRSFSGDFFERISTGFGDCTLRRVESQRESKASKLAAGNGGDHHCMKERVKCGGLFSGFMMNSSSSSSSSSSYWVSSSTEELNRKPTPALINGGRSKSWSWAFASPMRAFSNKPSNSKDRKRSIIRQASENNPSPDLNAIPSLLTVRS